MDAIFPLGFPLPTSFYMVLYVVTLVLHVLCMNYVIAGAGYLAFACLFPGGAKRRCNSPLAETIRDWLPFALGAAITAGVAPLLFVQILYKEPFYTANLLLSHRWMAILPVLIAGFYLLYLLKSRAIEGWHPRTRILAGIGAFLCFAFTGYSWSENHVLALAGQETWNAFYETGRLFHMEGELHPRLLVFLVGSIPTLCLLAGWQLRRREDRGAAETRRLALLALGGLLVTGLAAFGWYKATGAARREAVFSAMAVPYFAAAAAGALLQGFVWALVFAKRSFAAPLLWTATASWVVTVLGMNVAREAVRVASFPDFEAFYPAHAAAFRVAGFPVFLVFAVVSGAILFVALRAVRRDLRQEVPPGPA